MPDGHVDGSVTDSEGPDDYDVQTAIKNAQEAFVAITDKLAEVAIIAEGREKTYQKYYESVLLAVAALRLNDVETALKYLKEVAGT